MLARFLRLKFWYLGVLGLWAVFYGSSHRLQLRWDLTQEKRFSLSQPAQQILAQIREPIRVHLLFDGELPSEFRKLGIAAMDLLAEFNFKARKNIHFYQSDIFSEIKNDSMRTVLLDSLQHLGLRPTNITRKINKGGEGRQKQVIYPGAILSYKNRVIAVNFLSENLINNIQSLNNAEALLEYKLMSAIDKLINPVPPTIAYATGHGEPLGFEVYDLFTTLARSYRVDTFNILQSAFIPSDIAVLLVVKPRRAFSDLDKLKVDQFIMRGGRVLWALDLINAEMQTLQDKGTMLAQAADVRLEDMLFHYGIRCSYQILLDREADRLPFQVGWNGEQPQFELLPWYFFPLLTPQSAHPVVKNIDRVRSKFPAPLYFTKDTAIQKTMLLTTSQHTTAIGTPYLLSWQALEQIEAQPFRQGETGVLALSEGHFKSFYRGALTESLRRAFPDSLFLSRTKRRAKIVVASDADIFLNDVSPIQGPFEMGVNPYTKYKFGNQILFENIVSYLSSDNGLIACRNKSQALRILDKKKIQADKRFWQLLNIFGPMLLFICLFGLYQVWRYRRYGVN